VHVDGGMEARYCLVEQSLFSALLLQVQSKLFDTFKHAILLVYRTPDLRAVVGCIALMIFLQVYVNQVLLILAHTLLDLLGEQASASKRRSMKSILLIDVFNRLAPFLSLAVFFRQHLSVSFLFPSFDL